MEYPKPFASIRPPWTNWRVVYHFADSARKGAFFGNIRSMQKFSIAAAALALLVAGCFTVDETPFPTVPCRAHPAAATNVAVCVQGFATTLTDYVPVDGYQTIFYQGGCRYGGGIATAHTTSFVPQQHASDAFLEQAKSRLESIGFNIMAQTPDYVVEARFTGPETTGSDTAKTAAWIVCSLLTCDHAAESWQARLKIHDNRTGRLVLARDYEQRYEVTGFSPIPLIGISYYERTSSKYMQCWCLGALTERIVADAAEFLTSRK